MFNDVRIHYYKSYFSKIWLHYVMADSLIKFNEIGHIKLWNGSASEIFIFNLDF